MTIFKNIAFLTLLLHIFCSCAFVEKVRSEKKGQPPESPVVQYILKDLSGVFSVVRESGLKRDDGELIVKRRVLSKDGKELERSISISKLGKLKNEITIAKPSISQYTVWFDGKKYFTEMKVNSSSRQLELRMKSPEAKWNGVQTIDFPTNGTGVFCFFGQLIECIKVTNFLDLSEKKGAGEMTFHVVWDGYPYFQEQYSNIPGQIFSPAKFFYEGKTKTGERKYVLLVGEHSLIYFIDRYDQIKRMIWISQGFTMVKSQ